MEGKYRYVGIMLALLAGFLLFCAGAFAVQSSWREPYRVRSEYRLPDRSGLEAQPEEETGQPEEEPRPDSLLPGEVIDVNQADLYDLQRLPGIGEKRAQDIIAWREEHGPFQSLEELTQVSGIGPGILEGLRAYASASQCPG